MSETFNGIFTPLHHLGLIYISGEDALKFLNGQATTDFSQIPEKTLVHGAVCTPKGRVVANFMTTIYEEGFLLLTPISQTEHLILHLKKYSVFYKVTLTDISNSYILFGFSSKNSEVGETKHAYAYSDKRCIKLFDKSDSGVQAEINKLGEKLEAGSQTLWEVSDIQEGLPWILAETRELFIPQNINLHWINGISFRKGCYTGQEIVARMHHKGKLKSYTHLCQSSQQLSTGQKLFDSNEKAVGQVINYCDGWALVMVQHLATEQGVFANTEVKLKLEFSNLPYSDKMVEE